MTKYIHTNFKVYLLVSGFMFITACAGLAPVQEMSNARQTLHLAKAAKAEKYALENYSKAQDFLDRAVNQLNSGDYTEARRLALQATHEAKQAHLVALNQRKR